MSGIYDVTLAPGAVANIAASGDYFKIRSAPFGLLEVKLDGGEAYGMDEGLGVRLPDGKSFRDLSVRNRSTIAQTVLIFIGDSRFEDSRITGVVTVIDQAKKRSQAGLAFIGAFAPITGTAGQNATLQLFNATNSGNIGYVSKLSFYSATAQIVKLGQNDTILANITGTPANKLAGSSAGALILANESRVGNPVNFTFLAQYIVPANSTVFVAFDEPIILPLGRALVLQAVTAATDLGGTVEYTQERV